VTHWDKHSSLFQYKVDIGRKTCIAQAQVSIDYRPLAENYRDQSIHIESTKHGRDHKHVHYQSWKLLYQIWELQYRYRELSYRIFTVFSGRGEKFLEY
jgi:hypothetical protein